MENCSGRWNICVGIFTGTIIRKQHYHNIHACIITWNVNVIFLPMEHQGVHKNLFRNVCVFQDRIGIWKCWFLRRGENRSTRRKSSQSRVENQQQTQPTYDTGSGNWTWDTMVGGERSHHFANPAPMLSWMPSTKGFMKKVCVFSCPKANGSCLWHIGASRAQPWLY